MNRSGAPTNPLLLSILRLTPALTALLFVPLPSDPEAAAMIVGRLLALTAILLAWNITEACALLYVDKRADDPSSARGYGIVVVIFAIVLLALFQPFRLRATQALFLFLLSVLSLRGMSRAAWQQERYRVAMFTTLASHSLLTMLSLLCALPQLTLTSFPALSFLVGSSLAVGTALTSVELAAHNQQLGGTCTKRIAAPLFRVTLIGGPLMVGVLALTNEIPSLYAAANGAVIAALPILKSTARSGLPVPPSARGTAGVYLLFVAIMVACRVISGGIV